ncbi:MAG: CBS domain-containing protein [Chloroflexota bacterium]
MHVILTHEQADFDAVASLWAASLLEPEALPVLPRRINRNVRGYLTLYGEHFSFDEAGDLRYRDLNRLTIVDTQAPASAKGLTSRTAVRLIDHHPRESGLDPSWSIQVEPVGATATLLVEALQETGRSLDAESATLLLLGVYEDTGSLMYPGTTARDVRACAWLLEQGASLAVANEFLNPPLSPQQRELYARLLGTAELHQISGLPILIAGADGAGMEDEISSLAHRLGEAYEASGLFLLVTLAGGIQLVARSSTESLDVGAVASVLGGGGHRRAAAALIKDGSLAELRSRLLKLLQEMIQPTRTVAEIMSRGPQLLRPSLTVREAADQMQRFGHEGYPVTDDGQVVGLLTRRAVDRAMAHGMQARPISDIMEAGSLVVHPEDSVWHLQRVMIEHQWGQVPVSDPKTGEVIGIVTRTDLLNSLSGGADSNGTPSLTNRLNKTIPAARLSLLKLIADEAVRSGSAFYLVGGFVRDLLLERPSTDFDLVVEGDAIALAMTLAGKYGGKVNSHRRFGTAKWRLDPRNTALATALRVQAPLSEAEGAPELPESLDFVSARTEFYKHPTALPSVAEGSIKLDLHRRDFSINTLALRLDGRFYGQLLDYWGGGRDLREGQIRVLHSLSFVDDPTRMLRAVRLEQRLGFSIEARTLELMGQALPLLSNVSGARIRAELADIFAEDQLVAIIARLAELGLLEAIHSALTWDGWLKARFEEAGRFSVPSDWRLEPAPALERLRYSLWLYRLAASDAQSVCNRLSFSQADRTVILAAGRYDCELTSDLRPSQIVTCLESLPEESLVAEWLALDGDANARRIIGQFLSAWRWVRQGTDGSRLRELGLPAGPAYRQILGELRAAWLDGQISTDSEEQTLLARLIAEAQQRG